MRPFRISDLLWLEPLAKAQGRWAEMLAALEAKLWAYVVAPEALAIIWRDEHGLVIGGITNLPHIKSVYGLTKALTDTARETGMRIHTHDPVGTLGRKLAARWGYVEHDDAMWLEPEGVR